MEQILDLRIWPFSLFAFTSLGLAIGSFLNVCIYRVPRNKSIVSPGSSCPHCGRAIIWRDNIPILSFILLRGRCRWCQGEISLSYPLVEALTGLLFGVFYYQLVVKGGGHISAYVAYVLLGSALIASSFIDIEFFVIPNEITYLGMAFGPIFSLFFPALHPLSHSVRLDALAASLLGIVVGGGMVLLVAVVWKMVLGKEGMGIGDAKLLAMVGGITGWKLTVVIFFLAPFFALVVSLPLLFLGKGRTIPYAPFLSIATLVSIPFQEPFVRFLDSRIYIFRMLFKELF